MLMSWSLMSVFVLFIGQSAGPAPPKQVSVCDVLGNPKKYDHQTVTVHALLVSSLGDTDFDELIPLPSESCFNRAQQDELAIGLGGAGGIPDIPKDFQPDVRSYERAGQALEKLRETNP